MCSWCRVACVRWNEVDSAAERSNVWAPNTTNTHWILQQIWSLASSYKVLSLVKLRRIVDQNSWSGIGPRLTRERDRKHMSSRHSSNPSQIILKLGRHLKHDWIHVFAKFGEYSFIFGWMPWMHTSSEMLAHIYPIAKNIAAAQIMTSRHVNRSVYEYDQWICNNIVRKCQIAWMRIICVGLASLARSSEATPLSLE